MKFRGLRTERRDVGPAREDMRREIIVETVFQRGLATDAKGLWGLMAYAHSGKPQVMPGAVARSFARAERLKSSS